MQTVPPVQGQAPTNASPATMARKKLSTVHVSVKPVPTTSMPTVILGLTLAEQGVLTALTQLVARQLPATTGTM